MHRNIRAAVSALVLSIAIAAPVAAADVTDSFTVNGTITVTGIPATLSYGSLDAGQTSSTYTIDALVSANSPWTMNLSGTDFAKSGGGTPVDKSARHVILSTDTAGTTAGLTFDMPFIDRDFGSASLTDPEAEVTGPVGSALLVRGEYSLIVPGATVSGSYSGTITYTFSAV